METHSPNLTRIAPTPSGYLHIGNLYSFVITWLIARRKGAKILLRIDDLDAARARAEYIDDIFQTLEFARLDYDLGPSGTQDFLAHYSQRHRLDLYKDALRTLEMNGAVFPCRCSRKRIQEAGTDGCAGQCEQEASITDPDVSWRLHTGTETVAFRDIDSRILTAQLPDSMRQTVLRKKDSMPSYQLANVIDDSFYGVDLIVRGKDLFPSTIVQLAIAGELGDTCFARSAFHHHDLITRSGVKLSKTQNAPAVRSEFPTREALFTHLAAMFGASRGAASLPELHEILESDQLFPLTAASDTLALDNPRSPR